MQVLRSRSARNRSWNKHAQIRIRGGGVEQAKRIARSWAEQVWLRMDAGFPESTLLDRLEEEGFLYVARLNGNAVLKRMAEPYLTQPPAEGQVRTHELTYRATKWTRPRRVVPVVLERMREQGELFLEHFFPLTNVSVAEVPAERLLERYRQRGTAEKDFGEWKQALDISLSSSPRPKDHYRGREVEAPHAEPDSFAANEARLLLSLIAANLMHAATALLECGEAARPSRERFRQLVLKSAALVVLGRAAHHLRDRILAGHTVATLRTRAEPPLPRPSLTRSPGPAHASNVAPGGEFETRRPPRSLRGERGRVLGSQLPRLGTAPQPIAKLCTGCLELT